MLTLILMLAKNIVYLFMLIKIIEVYQFKFILKIKMIKMMLMLIKI